MRKACDRSRFIGRSSQKGRQGVLCLLALLLSFAAMPQAAAKCVPIAGLQTGIVTAALPAAGTVRLTFLGHSSFLIETPGGVTVVTDYNGINRTPDLPDVVTMNNAHETHYTDFVDPDIELVLRGWDPTGGMAVHDHKVGDLRVWNVATNVREYNGTRFNGNSIFIFEAAGLCIAHLGHLHHLLTDQNLGELGAIDVLLVPVDGAYTMAQEFMIEVLDQILAPVVIPMHYFSGSNLKRFLTLLDGRYEVLVSETPSVELSRRDLPYRKVLVLPGK